MSHRKMIEESSGGAVNWLPQYQYFSRTKMTTLVRVLNLVDQPYKVKARSKGEIGYFMIDEDSLQPGKDKLKELLKEKYGYYKIRLRSNIRDRFFFDTNREYNSEYSNYIGDSVWMDKKTADRYKLTGTATREIPVKEVDAAYGNAESLNQQSAELINVMKNEYSVCINKLGWINCDRFYNDPREKLQYAVNLGEPAINYYTMLVFDDIKSIMNGYADGNKAIFSNVPKEAKVKVISIGVNSEGKTVYTIQPATINSRGLAGLHFESTSATGLKASLSKIDR